MGIMHGKETKNSGNNSCIKCSNNNENAKRKCQKYQQHKHTSPKSGRGKWGELNWGTLQSKYK